MASKSHIFLLQFLMLSSIRARFATIGEDSVEKEDILYLPASDAQKNYIKQSVCNDIIYDLGSAEAVQKCKENFIWDMDRDNSGFQITCRSDSSVTLNVPPSNLYQVVLLSPDPNIDKDDPYSIIYSIINPNKSYVVMESTPDANYSIFSTVLDKRGRPIVWHHESILLNWEAPPHREYEMRVTFEKDANLTVTGVIGWNEEGQYDRCFELVTSCDKSRRSISMKIWPDSPAKATVKGLPANDSCTAKLTGLYGTTRYKFRTPASKIPEKPTLTYPKDIVLEAQEQGDSWAVHVSWQEPELAPDSYNITVRADDVISTVVPGNATEVTINGVTGTGFYNVSVYTILGHRVLHTSRIAIFPPRSFPWLWAGAAGGAWLAVGAGAVASVLYWMRLRRRRALTPAKAKEMIIEKSFDDTCVEPAVTDNWLPDSWELKLERLLLHEVIGEGAFGVVRRGTLAPHGREVAVKMMKDFPSAEEARSFRVEMELMKSVGVHPHVVSLVGCCSGARPLIVAEYCSRGDLLNFLRCSWDVMVSKRNANYYNNNNINSWDYRNDLFRYKPQESSRLVINKMYDLQGVCDTELTTLDLLSFCRQIAMGMEFLALNKLVHRDLAARNILVTNDRTLKIADFGLSRDVYEENQYKQKGNGKMPIKWMAPESLNRRIFTTQSDVWSFGVVVWEVVTLGAAPYAGVPPERLPRLLHAGYRMPKPNNCSKQLYDLMLSCWAAHARARPTFAELHEQLDALLQGAAGGEYLALELADEPPPPRYSALDYFAMLLTSKRRSWKRGESYERPLKASRNHYTSTPVTLNRSPA